MDKIFRIQLALCLECFGCYGDGISSGRIVRAYGVGRGTVSLLLIELLKLSARIKISFFHGLHKMSEKNELQICKQILQTRRNNILVYK